MAVSWYGDDPSDYIEGLADAIDSAVKAGYGPLTAGILAIALVNPGDWNAEESEPLLRKAFAQSRAAHDTELADTVISTLVKNHDALLGLAA